MCIRVGILVDSEIVLSTRYGKTMVFMNKTLSRETVYQQDLIMFGTLTFISDYYSSWGSYPLDPCPIRTVVRIGKMYGIGFHSVRVRWISYVKFQIIFVINY